MISVLPIAPQRSGLPDRTESDHRDSYVRNMIVQE